MYAKQCAYSFFYLFCFLYLGDHSKITLNTKNVFIEITATDIHKVSWYFRQHDHLIYLFLFFESS